MVFLAFTLGVAAGGGAVLSWQEQPAPPPAFRADEHGVEVVLFEAVPPRRHPNGRQSEVSPLHVDSAIVLSEGLPSTITGIGALDRSLDVRVPALPLTVSPTSRFRSVKLKIRVRDCEAATRWTPRERPFTITWRDQYGEAHLDRAGDFGSSVASSLVRYINSVCDTPPKR